MNTDRLIAIVAIFITLTYPIFQPSNQRYLEDRYRWYQARRYWKLKERLQQFLDPDVTKFVGVVLFAIYAVGEKILEVLAALSLALLIVYLAYRPGNENYWIHQSIFLALLFALGSSVLFRGLFRRLRSELSPGERRKLEERIEALRIKLGKPPENNN